MIIIAQPKKKSCFNEFDDKISRCIEDYLFLLYWINILTKRDCKRLATRMMDPFPRFEARMFFRV